ncbi:MAG: hypothetical protein LUH14_07755 [Clostridiaceae bacterium]|nr:hypothetical protein [Clostridiaceae bacterium]
MDAKSNETENDMMQWLLEEITSARKAGMTVAVDGRIYSSCDSLEQMMLMEHGCYMKSYVSDDHGRIVRIDFDHIGSV